MELTQQLDALHAKYRATNKAAQQTGDWYRIENKANAETDIHIYDEIGFWGVTAQDFLQELTAVNAATINLHLNSPGGSVFDGIAIYSTLRQHPATVNVIIDSLAASIASVIAMAGDTIQATPNAMMMVHDGMGLAVGNAAEHREMADLLDKVSDNIASVYAERTGDTAEEWRAIMREERWYNATEAVEAGLVDSVVGADGPTNAAPDPVVEFWSQTATFSASSQPTATTPEPGTPPNPQPQPQLVFDPDQFRDAIRKAVA